jgi:hypothetical protein
VRKQAPALGRLCKKACDYAGLWNDFGLIYSKAGKSARILQQILFSLAQPTKKMRIRRFYLCETCLMSETCTFAVIANKQRETGNKDAAYPSLITLRLVPK